MSDCIKKAIELGAMMESTDFIHSVSYQKELILKLQALLKKEIEGKADSERIEELASAIESATEALNNLTQYFRES